MHFFGLSLVTFITAALASNTCKIVGGKGDGLCRKCPYKSCDIVKRFDYGKSYKFDCQKWGGYVEDGRGHRDNGWDYSKQYHCYVWRYRTDNNCCGNCLPDCDRWSGYDDKGKTWRDDGKQRGGWDDGYDHDRKDRDRDDHDDRRKNGDGRRKNDGDRRKNDGDRRKYDNDGHRYNYTYPDTDVHHY